MTSHPGFSRAGAGLPSAFRATGSSSFSEFLRAHAPELLPAARTHGSGPTAPADLSAHATTVVAVAYPGGVVVGGDRRATSGSMISNRDMTKVFAADEYSAVGIAGTAGLALDLVTLFQVELEHYEKLEGTLLSLEGKANRLSTMIRANLGNAMQGLVVLPLFAGYDLQRGTGRIFSYDAVGGCYEEKRHHGVGSGSVFARGSLKKLWRPDLDAVGAVRVVVEALYDAADDDSATGGPDPGRRLWPTVAVVDTLGARFVPEDGVAEVALAVVADRTASERAASADHGGERP